MFAGVFSYLGPARARLCVPLDRAVAAPAGALARRKLAQRLALAPRAQTDASWTRQAEPAMRPLADRKAALARGGDALGEALFKHHPLGGGVAHADPLPALQKPVHDLHLGGTFAQHRECIEQPLNAIVTLHQLVEIDARLDAIALVVEHQARAVGLARHEVDHAGDQRLLRAEREGERMLATHRMRRSHARRQRRARAAETSLASSSRSRAATCMPSSRAARSTSSAPRVAHLGEVRQLHQPVHQRAACARLQAAAHHLPAPPRDPRAATARVRGSSDSRSAPARSASCS